MLVFYFKTAFWKEYAYNNGGEVYRRGYDLGPLTTEKEALLPNLPNRVVSELIRRNGYEKEYGIPENWYTISDTEICLNMARVNRFYPEDGSEDKILAGVHALVAAGVIRRDEETQSFYPYEDTDERYKNYNESIKRANLDKVSETAVNNIFAAEASASSVRKTLERSRAERSEKRMVAAQFAQDLLNAVSDILESGSSRVAAVNRRIDSILEGSSAELDSLVRSRKLFIYTQNEETWYTLSADKHARATIPEMPETDDSNKPDRSQLINLREFKAIVSLFDLLSKVELAARGDKRLGINLSLYPTKESLHAAIEPNMSGIEFHKLIDKIKQMEFIVCNSSDTERTEIEGPTITFPPDSSINERWAKQTGRGEIIAELMSHFHDPIVNDAELFARERDQIMDILSILQDAEDPVRPEDIFSELYPDEPVNDETLNSLYDVMFSMHKKGLLHVRSQDLYKSFEFNATPSETLLSKKRIVVDGEVKYFDEEDINILRIIKDTEPGISIKAVGIKLGIKRDINVAQFEYLSLSIKKFLTSQKLVEKVPLGKGSMGYRLTPRALSHWLPAILKNSR
jgi:Fe2+ or Zn2+ uptake regulation protein